MHQFMHHWFCEPFHMNTFILSFVNNADCLFRDAQLDLIRRYPHET